MGTKGAGIIPLIIMSLLAFLCHCYQGTPGRTIIEDSVSDLPHDVDGPGDLQQEMGDARDSLNGLDLGDMVEDGPSEGYEDCDPANLVLQPVNLVGIRRPMDCEEVGISEIRVLLFQGADLVLDSTLPCIGDPIVVGPVAPGSYDLAAVAGPLFVMGVELLRLVYPEVPICDPHYIACSPLTITIAACESTIVELNLYCDESFAGCYGCCGDG